MLRYAPTYTAIVKRFSCILALYCSKGGAPPADDTRNQGSIRRNEVRTYGTEASDKTQQGVLHTRSD